MRYLYFQPVLPLTSCNSWRTPRHHNIISLLQSCSRMEALPQVHAQMIRTGLMLDTFLASRIIAFLTSPPPQSNMHYARLVFDQIRHPNLFIWNSMIRGYTRCNASDDALLLYKMMLLGGFIPDSHTYTVVSRACAQLAALQIGRAVHGQVLRCGFGSDMYVMSGLINLYSNCGEIDSARVVFDEMPERDVVLWTSMVSSYAHLNLWDEVFHLIHEMKETGVKPNQIMITRLLSACRQSQALDQGCRIHTYAIENNMVDDTVVSNSLLNMYSKCGSMLRAVNVFKNMPLKDTVSWNVLISGYVQNRLYSEALTVFHEMADLNIMPDEITAVSVLSACAQLGDLQQGKNLHDHIEEGQIVCDVFVLNALVNMYCKCGDLEKAQKIFIEMPKNKRDVCSWTAMISGYVQENCLKEAMDLFQEMLLSNVGPTEITLVCVLSACAQLGALDQGKRIHLYIEENKVKKVVSLQNALLDMYAKCGCLKIALDIFHSMRQKDTLSWNTMIGGLATHGRGKEAIDLFNQMKGRGDPKPDSVTLLVVLSACSHSGMVCEGFDYFNSMTSLYSIIPVVEHYGCMVDLLGRAGLIDEAVAFIADMPLRPNSVIWGSLLAACRVHRSIELGEKVAQEIVKLAPNDEGAHILISNLYAEAGRWDDVKRVRIMMGSKGIEKSPGCSSIELNGVIHDFFVGDTSLHWNNLLHLVLSGLQLHMGADLAGKAV